MISQLQPSDDVDDAAAVAVDLARLAAQDEAGSAAAVGEPLPVSSIAEGVAAHAFECLLPGYLGWQWSVIVARVPESSQATVSEVVLIPGEGALVAPQWLPWAQRVRSGDLSAGLVVTTDPDDERLASGWSGREELTSMLDDAPLHPANWEPWLNRARVPSAEGRRDAAERWYAGEHGPQSVMARAAAGQCGTCGWLLLIGGPLGQVFGVCSHMLSPSDGRIVSFDHGCGAHSEVQLAATVRVPTESRIDDYAADSLDFGHS